MEDTNQTVPLGPLCYNCLEKNAHLRNPYPNLGDECRIVLEPGEVLACNSYILARNGDDKPIERKYLKMHGEVWEILKPVPPSRQP